MGGHDHRSNVTVVVTVNSYEAVVAEVDAVREVSEEGDEMVLVELP